MIKTISHITITVRNVERTGKFLQTVFDAKEVYDSSEKKISLSYEKFFVIGDIWIAVMEGEPLQKRSYNHVAFKVSDSEFDEYVSKIKNLDLDIKPDRNRMSKEARSIYFYDYDNHLFELHTGTLDERLLQYSKT